MIALLQLLGVVSYTRPIFQLKYNLFVDVVIQWLSVSRTVAFFMFLYWSISFFKSKTPLITINGVNSMLLNISNVIITKHPSFSLTESVIPIRFTHFEARTILVVSWKCKKNHLLIKNINFFFLKQVTNTFNSINTHFSPIRRIFLVKRNIMFL